MVNQNRYYSIGKTSNVDIRLLSVFAAVVEAGGFTQAQDELNLSLSSISIAINDLETRLGLKLCNRGRSGFSLTENGRAVHGHIQQIFSSLDRFNECIADLKGNLSGELNIGILDNSTMSPGTRIPEVIHHFSEQHPDIHISIKVLPSEDIEAELMTGSMHFGIGLFPDLGQSLEALVSFPVIIDLYCGTLSPLFSKDKISLTDIQDTGYAKGSYSPDVKSRIAQTLPLASASSRSSEGLAFLIMSGRYVGYLPRRYAANWIHNGDMRALPQDLFSHELQLSLVTRRGEAPSPLVSAFLTSFTAFSDEGRMG